MSRFQLCLILVGVAWMAIISTALAWLRAAAIAGERVDQTMADHQRDRDQT